MVWGEYAVLAGAPALVMAVDRLAEVSVSSAESLTVSAAGFKAETLSQAQLSWSNTPVAQMCERIFKTLGYPHYPEFLAIAQHTEPFFQDGLKLGLGSSAALCVALYRAITTHLSHEATLAEAMQIHRQFQGGSGSGLDVAASWHGGLIRFQDGQAKAAHWPDNLAFKVIFTGQSASTHSHIVGFSKWRATANTEALDRLIDHTSSLDQDFSLRNLNNYVNALVELDRAAGLNIFTPQHQWLRSKASECGVIYKPCGAGGGDIGIVVTEKDNDRTPVPLTRFIDAVAQKFTVLDLGIASVH